MIIIGLISLIALMSIILFVMMGIDKRKAQTHSRRISEKALFIFAILGGALGGTIGMLLFRHKTKHWYFRFGFPLIMLAQLAMLVLLTGVKLI